MKFRMLMLSGAAILVFLSGYGTAYCAEQGPDPGKATAVGDLLRLLESKGIISKEESRDLKQKISQSPKESGETDRGGDDSPVAGPLTLSDRQKALNTLETLAKEGIIDSEEKEELGARLDDLSRLAGGAAPSERKRHIVGAHRIDNLKTAFPVNELRKSLKFLAYRNVMTRKEAADIYARFGELTEISPVSSGEGKEAGMAGDLKALVNLLREKGVISGSEVEALGQNIAKPTQPDADRGLTARKMLLPSEDKAFIAKLKELWVKDGNRPAAFDRLFGESRDIEEIIARLRVMGIVSAVEADELDKQYRETYLSGAVTTILETKEQDYLDRIKQNTSWEINDVIHEKLKDKWWQNIRLSGDMRLRYEGDFFDKNNADFAQPANPTQIMNSKTDRDRLRLRLRLDVDTKLSDQFEVGAGIATGTTSNPTQMVTLGDSFNNQSIVLSKAFMKWSPTPNFVFWGGRFVNPWFYTDLVWYPDLNFDGVAVQYSHRLTPDWSLFSTAGVFPLQEVELSAKDKWLFGGQLGVQYTRSDNLSLKLAAAYYDYEHTVGIVNNPTQPGLTDWTAPQFQQKGNTLMNINPSGPIKTAYASAFRELNFTGSLDLGYWRPVHVIFTGDYVNNLGFNQREVNARTGSNVKKETEGYQFGVSVGYPTVQDFGEWKGLFYYKYLEADAVMDAYADQDFHLGGTNAKGWIVGGDLGLSKNVWLSSRWFTANEISGPPLAIDVFHFNLNARF
jgi:hypothetical protein